MADEDDNAPSAAEHGPTYLDQTWEANQLGRMTGLLRECLTAFNQRPRFRYYSRTGAEGRDSYWLASNIERALRDIDWRSADEVKK